MSLKFEDKPDYSYLINLFKNCCTRYNYEIDNIYDWSKLNFDAKSPEKIKNINEKKDGEKEKENVIRIN